jgi:hypothetical protein
MAIDKKILCPMLGEQCIEDGAMRPGADGKSELVACRFWVSVQGKNPQTGEIVNGHDCAFAWMPVLMIENSKEQRSTAAELNAMRNENSTNMTRLGSALLLGTNPELLRSIQQQNGTDHAALPPAAP